MLRWLMAYLALAHVPAAMRAQESAPVPRTVRVQVIDSTTGRPLLRTILWEVGRYRSGIPGLLRYALGDTTDGVLVLDSVTMPHLQVNCAMLQRPLQAHLIAELDSAQAAAASDGDTLRLRTDGAPCDRRELTREYGTWTGHYVPGFESSDFRICGDTTRKIWVEFVPGLWQRSGKRWPKRGDPQYPRYFVTFRGQLRGPYRYGHLGAAEYQLTVDSIVRVRLATRHDC